MDCYYCHGNGEMECLECEGHGKQESGHQCGSCKGHGITPCLRCNGSGSLDYEFNEQDSIANILQAAYLSPAFSRGR
ncbi:hypothetical protein M5X00_00445 [Paenibacillus alvei]|uniref:Chaperone protein DnaJ n=1 Tax=Paenibacillus alvei TaxID=44250 RepID=A0AAP6ZVN5_PAEAL|nr:MULTISPECIES: hypothetical protein [Paenibacillus]EJW20284.1 hypothetical protein PAV_1c12830 [Paenibacillus alvei DSM 29]MCY7486596.1 hypothetical protein [Paenibacillus alvei]MCY9540217.1 hypothetical protein [Paenibacillus alvei]MCY9581323.1 hypothetical protein [Paenibacillus alvei]MCY9584387.1 hypothetical protein [Paenibacillus alvei]